MEKELKVHL